MLKVIELAGINIKDMSVIGKNQAKEYVIMDVLLLIDDKSFTSSKFVGSLKTSNNDCLNFSIFFCELLCTFLTSFIIEPN